ncbi:MAG: hypothetical protein QXV61_01355 [Archaeoglobaceae archaeon]
MNSKISLWKIILAFKIFIKMTEETDEIGQLPFIYLRFLRLPPNIDFFIKNFVLVANYDFMELVGKVFIRKNKAKEGL